ncbi:MAG: hypothetical protein GY870_01860 [archaeon]|nr:hypothetical protein [archaeon]
MQQTKILNCEKKQINRSIATIHSFKLEILKVLDELKPGFILNLQLIRIFSKRSFYDKKMLFQSLIELCKEGFIEALIPEDIYREWTLCDLEQSIITFEGEKDKDETLKIPKGAYYSWNYQRGLLNCARFNETNTNNKIILDTYDLRLNNPKIFDYALIKLALMLETNNKINFKLIWLLPEIRNDLPL